MGENILTCKCRPEAEEVQVKGEKLITIAYEAINAFINAAKDTKSLEMINGMIPLVMARLAEALVCDGGGGRGEGRGERGEGRGRKGGREKRRKGEREGGVDG